LPPVRRLVALMVLIAGLAGCRGGSRAQAPSPSTQTSPSPQPAASPEPSLLYVWRNFEETGIPEEATIYADGTVRYRNLLHTQQGIKVITRRIDPTGIERLVARVDLAHADASSVKPRRDGYRWVIRRNGVTGTAADGHVHGPLRVLVERLSALMNRLRADSL
jgi:hypothetical protein